MKSFPYLLLCLFRVTSYVFLKHHFKCFYPHKKQSREYKLILKTEYTYEIQESTQLPNVC
jgi:hypothetical protein